MLAYYLIRIFPVVAAVSALTYLPFYFWRRKRCGKQALVRHLTLYCLIGTLWSILYATVLFTGRDLTFSPEARLLNLEPFVWMRRAYDMGPVKMFKQLFMNVMMLVPLGLMIPMAIPFFRRWWKTILLISGLMLCIEIFQYLVGRSADIDDLIMNTAGGWIGYGLFTLCSRRWRGRRSWENALGATVEKRERG